MNKKFNEKDIIIRRPRKEDIKELHHFFRIVIEDTFIKEKIEDLKEDIEEEIKSKKDLLIEDFDSNGIKRCFLIALCNSEIVGTIEYGSVNELIKKYTDGLYNNLVEIGTVFVHPKHQKQGLGNLLLNEMFHLLQKRGIKEFCLDSGYIIAQNIWRKKFGEPEYMFKNYWDEGAHYMIWRVKLSDVKEVEHNE